MMAYLMWKHEQGFQQVFECLTQKRSVVSPNGGGSAIPNQSSLLSPSRD